MEVFRTNKYFLTMSILAVKDGIQSFLFESTDIRIVWQDLEPWFVAADVLLALKTKTKTNEASVSINDDLGDGYVTTVPIKTSQGFQNAVIFHLSALTLLVARSRTETGKGFNRYLHTQVLPTIRKTGKFVDHPEFEPDAFDVPKNYPDALRLAADLFDELHGLKQLTSSIEAFTLKQQELKRIEDELLDFEIAEKRSKLDFAKAKSTVVFNKGVAAWADEYLAYKIGNFEYVGMNAAFTDTLRYSYLSYCDRADFKPLGFQRFTPELIKYLQKGKKWKNLIHNRDSRGSRIFNIALI
jgi:prophage antirepressor-like protein